MMLRLIQFLAVVIVTSKCTADIMDSSSSNSIEVESQRGDAFVTPNQRLSGVKATVQRSADQYYPKRKYRNDPDNKPNQKIIEAISQRSTVSPGQNAIQTTLTEEVTPVDGSIPTTAKGFAVTKTFSATTTATPAATTMTATSTTLTTTTTTTATSTTTTTTTATVTTTITATTTTTTATSTTSTRVTATTTATAIITTATTLTTTTTTATSITTTTTTTSTSTSSTTTTTTTTTSSTTTATTKTMTTMSSHPLVEKRCSKEAFHEDVNGSQPTGSSLSTSSVTTQASTTVSVSEVTSNAHQLHTAGAIKQKRHISITLCAFLVFFALSMLFSAVMVVMIATGRLFANDKVDDGFPHYTLDEALL